MEAQVKVQAVIDGKVLQSDDVIKDFRGDEWRFKRVTRAPQMGRSAKVEVADLQDFATREFYVTVFPGLEVI